MFDRGRKKEGGGGRAKEKEVAEAHEPNKGRLKVGSVLNGRVIDLRPEKEDDHIA